MLIGPFHSVNIKRIYDSDDDIFVDVIFCFDRLIFFSLRLLSNILGSVLLIDFAISMLNQDLFHFTANCSYYIV